MGLELPGVNLLPLPAAEAALRGLLPGLPVSHLPNAAFAPDSILSVAKAAGAVIDSTPLPRWEENSDAEVYERLAKGWLAGGQEKVTIIPMDSLRAGRPLSGFAMECPQHMILSVIAAYLDKAGSPFFDGDTLFVSTVRGEILIFHHEGFGFRIRGIPRS
jgi:hypothetical protein